MAYKRPANTNEREMCIMMAELWGIAHDTVDTMHKRMGDDKYGEWQELLAHMRELYNDLLDTFPTGIRDMIKYTAQHMVIRTTPKSCGKVNDEWLCIKYETINVFAACALKNECSICMKRGDEIRKCELRRAFRATSDVVKDNVRGQCGYAGMRPEDVGL